MARWPAIDCDPFKFFYDHVAIFDTTLWCVLRFIDSGKQYSLSPTPTVVTGLPVYGHRRGYPVKNRVAPPELVLLPAKTLSARAEAPSKKLVSIYQYPGGLYT